MQHGLLRINAVLAACAIWAGLCAALPAADDTPPNPPPTVSVLPEKPPAWIEGYRLRLPLHVLGDPAKSTAKSVIARLPVGCWLKPDGSDVVVQTAAGQVLPVAVLSHNPLGDTLIQFTRNGVDPWYWAYAANPAANPPKAETLPEGTVLEVRAWGGDDLASWAAVRGGLAKSENVIGNAIVAEVIQNQNPVRPGESHNFAASYRGFLNLKSAGVYRFFVNSEDASFLFIDGFKVCDRPGSNGRVTGQVPLKTFGNEVELTAGVHPFEVHHVMGNSPGAYGICSLLWLPPGATGWTYVPRETYVFSDVAQVAAIQSPAPASLFVHGIDDTLTAGDGSTIYLVRFEANGNVADEQQLTWDFGDGTTGKGRSVTHVYFDPGTYTTSLSYGGAAPPCKRSVHVWAAPGTTSPFSLATAVKSLSSSDWKKFEPQRLNRMFMFLLACEQPDRWALVESLARHLLTQPDSDPQFRVVVYTSLMEALANLGRAEEGHKVGEQALTELAKIPSQKVEIKLADASLYHKYLKDPVRAGKVYEEIISEHSRLEQPSLRLAAVRWGDLYAEKGNLSKAGECYRLATRLGGEEFQTTAQSDAVTRGGMLRIAEQKLRAGDIRQTRVLLERIELNYPEQKLEGMYRFLRAEVDRFGGRYEDALRNYDVLLQLTQWAGFRDRALHGVADTYLRMGDFAKAQEWLGTLKKAYPKYYEKQKLDEYEKVVAERLARAASATQAGNASGNGAELKFQDVFSSFEPNEKPPYPKLGQFVFAPGLAMSGTHVGLLEGFPVYKGDFDYTKPLTNITANGNYWVELWYREELCHSRFTGYTPHIHVYIYGDAKPTPPYVQGTSYFDRTYGEWHKHGFSLKAPVTQDGRFSMTNRYIFGMVEIDNLVIREVGDRQIDSLRNFVEGTDQQ